MLRIKTLRKQAGMTQKQLAAMLNIGQSTVSMWESNSRRPSSDILPQMAQALHCSINELYDETA